jgi:hypothetical protein
MNASQGEPLRPPRSPPPDALRSGSGWRYPPPRRNGLSSGTLNKGMEDLLERGVLRGAADGGRQGQHLAL